MLLYNAFVEVIDKIFYLRINPKININKKSDKFSRLVLCIVPLLSAPTLEQYDSLILNTYNTKVIIAPTF